MEKSWSLTDEQKRKIRQENERTISEMRGYKRGPTINEIIEAYKKFIQDVGGDFLHFAEAYNEVLKVANEYGHMNSKLTVRIKDFSSANSNTDNKELDDMFGMEVATSTEEQKEILTLFNELIFKNTKSKMWNKTQEEGGYSAYHTTGMVQLKEDEDLQSRIIDIIENTNVEEWTSSKDKNIPADKRAKTSPYKNLQKLIQNPLEQKWLVALIGKMLEVLKRSDLDIDSIPIIEFHHITLEKQEEAITGSAAHSKYKQGLEEKIQQLFDEEKLFRGINAPWKFVGTDEGLKLQNFNETLRQNWPFLDISIKLKEIEGRGEASNKISRDFDRMLASQFKFLRNYVDGDVCRDPIKKAEIWGKLKMLIMHYRLDFDGDKQALAKEALDYLPYSKGEEK